MAAGPSGRGGPGSDGATMQTMPLNSEARAVPAMAGGLGLIGMLALGVAFGAIGPVAFIQRLGMLPVLAVATAGLAVAYRSQLAELPRRAALLIVLAACAWLLVSLAWAPRIQPDRVASAVATLLLCGVAAALAAPPPAPHLGRLRAVFLVTIALLTAALVFEAATDGAATDILRGIASAGHVIWARGAAVLVVVVWIALGLLLAQRRHLLFALLLVGAGAAIWGGTMRSAQVASVVGLVAFAAAAVAPRRAVALIAGLFGLYALATPWLSLHLITADAVYRVIPNLPLSAYHRLAIWEHAAARIVDAPILGLGFGTARWISDQHAHMVIAADPRASLEVMPLHTHNNWIQLWLETGLVGLLVALGAVALAVIGACRRYRSRPPLMAVAGALGGGLSIASMSFGVWQEWWLATLATAVVAMLVLFPAEAADQPPSAGSRRSAK